MIHPLTIDTKGISIEYGIDLIQIETMISLIKKYGIDNYHTIYQQLKFGLGYDMEETEILVLGYILGLFRSMEEIEQIHIDILKFNPN